MSIEELLCLIKSPVSKAEKKLIVDAFEYAKNKHVDQKRNSGEPYFMHSIEVAKNCANLGMDIETIVAAILHDTLEDTDATEDEIRDQFGENILFLVEGVTKLGKLRYQGQERHVESLRKFFMAMAQDIRVMIIKMADRLHNVQTLEYVKLEKQKRIALETIEVHAALAGRLGMEKLKGLLEDYSFPFAYPDEYKKTQKIMDEIVPETQKVVTYAHQAVQKVLDDFDLVNTEVESRVKHTYSTYKKLIKYKMNTEQVYDIVALRIVTKDITDCYQVLGLIHMLWKPIPKRIKDFIALPKPNGYQSLHTTVITEHGIVEIQIRTEQMHAEAEMGIASHFMYKEKSTQKKGITNTNKKFSWLDELKELREVVNNPSNFIEELHFDFFKDRIFVFTPQGDVIDLPEGASPVDFAYAVHTEIGNTISSARVNKNIAPLGAHLNNGDIVEIVTGKNAHPSSKWLEYAKTGFAKRKIKSYLEEKKIY